MKRKSFIMTSGIHSFKKEKYVIDFCAHITTPGPFKSFNLTHGVSTFCGSITGTFVWMGCYTEPESPGQWWARCCQWCHSQSYCFWELVLLKYGQLKETSNHKKYNGAHKRPGQKKCTYTITWLLGFTFSFRSLHYLDNDLLSGAGKSLNFSCYSVFQSIK